ncbi:MAG: hypothetical protein U1E45_24740 [Geminicoccaceae bacterium]
MRKLYSTVLAAGIGLAAVAAARPAAAVVWVTTHIGQECVQLGTTTPAIRSAIKGAYNNATSQVTWACPLNNDYLGLANSGNYFNSAYWWAVVDDVSGADNITCRIDVCNDTGVCSSGPQRSTSGTGSNLLISTVAGSSATTLQPYTNSARLICTIPARVGTTGRSGIQKYTLYRF